MPYCTIAQVETAVGGPARLLELSDLAGSGVQDEAADAVVLAAISEADGEIDMVIGHRFNVTVLHSLNPPALQFKSAAWAARLLRRNCFNGQPLEDDLKREETDRKWLDKVAEGTVSIGVEPSPEPASAVNDKFGRRDSLKTVSRLKLRGSW
jgi:phage gp36-like protein